MPFPESVQALIAARLDTLDAEAKSLLADAAVIGKVFWAGAISAMGDRDPQTVTAALRELSRKELVRPSRHSSMEGEAEYAFWHVLARDVAYSQLPRASRATRHVAAASWIESKAPERIEDLADVLAYHYATALELAQAAGQTDQAAELEAPALRFLGLAGERALGLDTRRPLRASSGRWRSPPGHPERAAALARFGEAALDAGRFAEARDALEEAIAAFEATGDVRGAAAAMGTFSKVLQQFGDPRGWTLPAEALALLEPLPPSPELVKLLTSVASVETLQGRNETGIRYADQALALAEQLGLEPPARALGSRGLGRAHLGDRGGLDDFREAIALATEAGQGSAAAVLINNLGVALWAFEGPMAALEVLDGAIAFAHPRGLAWWVDQATSSKLIPLFDSGQFDEAIGLAVGQAEHLADNEIWLLTWFVAMKVKILAVRGQAAEVADTLDWLETTIREFESSQHIVFGLGSAALARAALGQNDRAAALLAEIEANPAARGDENYADALPAMVRTALTTANPELAERVVTGFDARHPLAEHALTSAKAALAEAHGHHQAAAERYAEAAERWQSFGVVPEQAFALLGQGRCLVALGRPDRGCPAPQPGPRHLPGATGRPRARRDRRAPPTGDGAQLLSGAPGDGAREAAARHPTSRRAPVARQSDFPSAVSGGL